MSDRYGPRSGRPRDGGSYGPPSYGPPTYGPPTHGPSSYGQPSYGPSGAGRGGNGTGAGETVAYGSGAQPGYGAATDGYRRPAATSYLGDPTVDHDDRSVDPSGPDAAVPRRSRRGSTVVLVLAVVTSLLLFLAGFGALATVDLTSDHPIALPLSLLTTFAVLCVPAFLLFLVAVFLLVRRSRWAGIATAVSALLPLVATLGGFYLGFLALQMNATDDLDSAGALVVRLGDLADRWDLPAAAGPIRELGRAIEG